MSRAHRLPLLALWGVLSTACGDKDGTDTHDHDHGDHTDKTAQPGTSDTSATSTTGEDTGTGTTNGMPANPSPLTLTVSGVVNETLTFDAPTCTHPFQSNNFRVFWRTTDGSHVYVLIAELLGTFSGKPGTFNETEHSARVKLQEEAGGGQNYFTTEDGDSVTITVEHIDKKVAWGEFTASALQGEGGSITIDPQPIPIYCPSLN